MTHPLHEFFSKIRLFSQLNTDELNELLRAVQPIEVSANTRVFSTGDPGDGAGTTAPTAVGPVAAATCWVSATFAVGASSSACCSRVMPSMGGAPPSPYCCSS